MVRFDMNASLSSKAGKLVLEVSYDPATCNYEDAIQAAVSAYGIPRHQIATVIASPVFDTFSHKTKSDSSQVWLRDPST
jgi:hypothetical protein